MNFARYQDPSDGIQLGLKNLSKILLLERNTFIRETLRNILQGRFPDVVIKVVFSIDECAIETSGFKPDILFLGTAEKNSEELERLRQIRLMLPATTIIFFTEYDIDEYKKRAALEGINYVISKELWTGDEILALVKTILTMRNYQGKINDKGRLIEEKILRHPIERRKKTGEEV